MLESWILSKIDTLKNSSLIILRDPQRMIRPGARAVDGWAQENGYTVLLCTGNLALREMYERLRDQPDVKILLVDRSRNDGQLFSPDLEAASPQPPMEITLRDFLVEKTGDTTWPHLVADRNLSGLILANIERVIKAHEQLRQVSPTRFNDSDLYKIILGASLHINPFKKLSAGEVRKICLEQHSTLEELYRVLPDEMKEILQQMIQSAPKPFCYLLDRDPEIIIRAFTLAGILHQHGMDYSLLLANLDPSLHEYKSIEPAVLDAVLKDQIASDPDCILADVQKVEEFIKEDPKRLSFLLHDQLHLEEPKCAEEVLKKEQLSNLLRSIALASLLVDLILERNWKKHLKILKDLESQERDAVFPVLRRPTEQWQQLLSAYKRAVSLYELTGKLRDEYKDLKVSQTEELNFAIFDQLWNQERLNRLDFYVSDLERMLRVSDMLPVPHAQLWPEFENRWNNARTEFKSTAEVVEKVFQVINQLFQDLYHKNYTKWILQKDSPVVFTHQFLNRMLKAHWDPKSGVKAVIMVFDGLRTDAWDEFVRPVLEEQFEIIESRPGSALIPTETELSRKAIAAGALPIEFPIRSKRELDLLAAWLKTNMSISPQFSVLKDDDTVASGMTVRYQSKELDYIVFNFTDDNLHHNNQDLAFIYNTTVREIIRQDVRSVMRELPANAMVFVTSDHGFTPMPRGMLDVPDEVIGVSDLVKYRNVRASHNFAGEEAKQVVSFDIRALKIPIPDVPRGADPVQSVLFPRPGYNFRRAAYKHTPDRYSHGGLSLAECMVPMVVMGRRRQDQGVLTLEDVQQIGSMNENEPLEIAIKVRSNQMIFDGLALTLSFSTSEITDRKEFFIGIEKVYQVQWKPKLNDITEEERNQGFLEIPVTVILTYAYKDQSFRQSKTADLRIRLDTNRLRRRIDSRLDLLMGKTPKELKG
ncbi:MAG: PglZ domain-containing protein [Anaerolineaceae bacterium]|nr:PglZ domain-containing protein [Anaerolineaceae bacterium]